MPLINRNFDPSQSRYVLQGVFDVSGTSTVIVTGTTTSAGIVPEPCTFIGAQLAAFGVSGSPTFEVAVNRFIAGTGFTTWVLAKGTSNIPASFGTSGPGAFGSSLFGSSGMIAISAGSTLAQLLANDLITVTMAGANSAVTGAAVGVVLQPIQDIKQRFGLGM